MKRITIVASAVFVSALGLGAPARAADRVSVIRTAEHGGMNWEHGGMHWERGGRHGFGDEHFRGFAFGFGVPTWAPYYWAPYGGYWGPAHDGYGPNAYPYEGGVKLDISGPDPKQAKVYANGDFVGTDNQFRGIFHQLSLRPGRYTIEVRAKGYEPLKLRLLVQPDKTITYKGQMKKIA